MTINSIAERRELKRKLAAREHVVEQSGIRTDKNKRIYQYILQFEKMIFSIWTHTFCNLDKYILQFRQINFAIWTNTF